MNFNNEEQEQEIIPELKDILEMIKRYNATHREGCFIFSFLGFEKDPDNICTDCGEPHEKISDKHTLSGMHGDLWTLRDMINVLRDMVEDEVDEEGFVSF